MATTETTTKEVIRRGIASSFYKEIIDPKTSYFIVLGRSYPWTDKNGVVLTAGGETIPYASDSVDSYNFADRDSFFAKRIGANDIRLMIPLVQWTQGTRYSKYSSNINIFDELYLFYVYTSDGSVYKCIENGRNNEQYGVPSLFEPNVKDTANNFSTPDGYVWKYMYSIPDYEKRLITSFSNETNYIPVSNPVGNYSFGERIAQFEVQENAVAGTVDSIFISPSTGLSYSPSNPSASANIAVSSAKNREYKIVNEIKRYYTN